MALKKIIGCRVTPTIYSILESKAKNMDLSIGEFLRLLVQKYIETNHRQELNKMVLKGSNYEQSTS